MVRAHPTVPAFTPLNCHSALNCRAYCRDTCAVALSTRACESSSVHPQFRQALRWGEWMTIFRAGHFQFGLLLATALSISIGPAAGQAYTPEQEQACTGDAFRLCSSDIPDIGRVTACMVRNKSQLSPACQAHFRPDPEPGEAGQRSGRRSSVPQHRARP